VASDFYSVHSFILIFFDLSIIKMYFSFTYLNKSPPAVPEMRTVAGVETYKCCIKIFFVWL